MSRDEAISILERVAHTESKWPGTEDTLEALDMAISALQQQDVTGKDVWKNDPLTLDELRKMDGEPVYIHSDTFPGDCGWRVVKKDSVLDIQFTDGDCFLFTFYGKSWIAYRRKPQEAQK